MKEKYKKCKKLYAWQKFLKHIVEHAKNNCVTADECIKNKLVKDKKAFHNMLYTLETVKELVVCSKSVDMHGNDVYDIILTSTGWDAVDEIDSKKEIEKAIEQPEQNDKQSSQDDNVVVICNGQVVHAFKKDDVVKFLDLLDSILNDFALAGIFI